jgi:hypothetical protein
LNKILTTIFFFLLLSETSLAQTVIKLTLNRGPWKDHRWEPHQFVNAGDSAFLSLGVGVQLDEPQYQFKSGIPDGAYSIFVNDTLSLTAFFKHQLEDSVWTFYKYGRLWYTRTFAKGSVISETSYWNNPNQPFFNLCNFDSTIKIPYEIDTETLVVQLTEYAVNHPVQLNNYLKRNGLVYNNEDYDKVIHPFRLVGSAIRVYNKDKSGFPSSNCTELKLLREKTKLIKNAGPRILTIHDAKISNARFGLFTNYITVYIKLDSEKEFENFISQGTTIISHKEKTDKETIYLLKYDNSIGADINEIAKKLLDNKIVLRAYPFFENLEPKDSHQARF